MDIQARLGAYINSKGVRLTWIAERIKNNEPDINFDCKKLSQCLLGKRKMSLEEFYLVCNALETNPDMFFYGKDTA